MADNQELFDCVICLQLLEDPVTTPCGHNYCKKCINTFWDKTNNKGRTYSCPHCRESFYLRPVLKRNTLVADLLEQQRRKRSQNIAAADTCSPVFTGQCDVCTGRKQKASMFCLVCLISYCDSHLQPHFEVVQLQKHSLISASAKVKENICGQHDKLLEMYCRTDQQFICLMCMMDEHKGHDTVAVTAEKSEIQRRLTRTKEEISDRVQNSKSKMAKLKEAAHFIRGCAWEACNDFEQLCEEHIRIYTRSVQRKCSDMREKVGEVEKTGVDQTSDCLTELQRQVSALRRSNDKLDNLSLIDDPIQFLKGFQALGDLPVFTDTHDTLDTLTDFVMAQKEKLQNMCKKEKSELSMHTEENVVSQIPRVEQEITSRKSLLFPGRNAKVEVDPCTVAACLYLSDGNRKLLWSDKDQGHSDHPYRFTYYYQALCKEGLKGNHYWEVEWDGGIVELAVSYKGIQRKGSARDCCFGHNNMSWKLICSPSGCTFWHNNLHKGQIPPVLCRRAGIYLDYEAGRLSFYSVTNDQSVALLHQVQATFTEPLYPGFSVDLGATLEICSI